MINLADTHGFTVEGKDLYEKVIDDARSRIHGFRLTPPKINMILSIQDRISRAPDGRFKIAGKRAQGGHLRLERFKEKFYSSRN